MAPIVVAGRRLALLALGGIALLAGLVGALVLLGVPVPAATIHLAGGHGVLMSLGFLGTLIALERAVALGRWWGYLAPLAAGLGAVSLAMGLPGQLGHGLLTVGAVVFVAMYVAFDRIQRSLHGTIQALGAIGWLGAGLLLLAGRGTHETIPWLAGFLVLTIAGERLELSRLVEPTMFARRFFLGATAIVCVGIGATVLVPEIGVRVAGAGLLGLAAWLARNDLARRTVRMTGLPRFVAVSLLAGYAWLAVAGAAWIAFGPEAGGAAYDAMLHALFLGFVISMVFGHAPIILPAVLRVPLPYHPRFFAHLGLLHAGLAVRIVAGDGLGWHPALVAGGVLNVAALLLFVVSSARSVVGGRQRTAMQPATVGQA